MPGLRWFPYDFRESHSDTPELVVTPRGWVTVTRAISGPLQNSWQRTQSILSAITALIAGSLLLVLAGRVLHLRIMLTDSSAAAGIYRITDLPAARGELVAACLPPAIA